MKKESIEYLIQEFLKSYFGWEFSLKKRVLAFLCLQFGDSGKGKFSNLFARWAKVIVRPSGGDNSGHTSEYKGQEVVTHLVPSGIFFPDKINIIGSDTVVNPESLLKEIYYLKSLGVTFHNFFISLRANLILPSHLILDGLGENKAGKGRIGTTRKGIGPCYADHTARRGLVMNHLLNPEIFRSKLRALLNYHEQVISGMGCGYEARQMLEKINPDYVNSIGEDGLFNADNIADAYLAFGTELAGFIKNTDKMIRGFLGKENIALEGAQGIMLDVDYGTGQFVTSSHCTPAGMAKGAGLRECDIDASFGIIKGFYMTRVGKGPFPTELGGADSEIWCNENGSKAKELEGYADATIFDPDPFIQGVALRRHAHEYGASTGRPRRIGWADLPMLRYALEVTGVQHLILTRLDILTGVKTINLCHSYEYDGPDYTYGEKIFQKGMIIDEAIPDPEFLENCKPVYKEFAGWETDIRGLTDDTKLPVQLTKITRYIDAAIDHRARIAIISTGPGPEETMFMP